MEVGIAVGAVPPFARMRERVARLAADGLRSFWWPDHLVAFHSPELWATGALARIQENPHYYADPFVCMTQCADAAGSARIGVCVTDPVRRMPATLLQTALSLDHVAPGRVVLGLGAGEHANYHPYGVAVASPAARLDAAAKQIRALLDDTQLPGGAVMGLRPPCGSSGPQLWVAAHGPRGFVTTGRYADGWIPNFLTVEEWHAGQRAVASAASAAGRDPRTLTYGLSTQVVVAENRRAARRLLEHPILKAYALLLPPERFAAAGSSHPLGGTGLRNMVSSAMGSQMLQAAEQVPVGVVAEQMLHGSPDDVVAALNAYEGVEHVVLWDPVPLVDLTAARTSVAGCVEVAARLQGAG